MFSMTKNSTSPLPSFILFLTFYVMIFEKKSLLVRIYFENIFNLKIDVLLF